MIDFFVHIKYPTFNFYLLFTWSDSYDKIKYCKLLHVKHHDHQRESFSYNTLASPSLFFFINDNYKNCSRQHKRRAKYSLVIDQVCIIDLVVHLKKFIVIRYIQQQSNYIPYIFILLQTNWVYVITQ